MSLVKSKVVSYRLECDYRASRLCERRTFPYGLKSKLIHDELDNGDWQKVGKDYMCPQCRAFISTAAAERERAKKNG